MLPAVIRDRVTFLGKVSEADKARMLRSVDVYVAPNTRGESFGMILTEAMAAGTAVVASDLDAFRRVLDGGRAGRAVPERRPGALAERGRRAARRPGTGGPHWPAMRPHVVAAYDWPVVAERVLEVYADRDRSRRPAARGRGGPAGRPIRPRRPVHPLALPADHELMIILDGVSRG